MSKVKPISPSEIPAKKGIPEEVIEAINELLIKRFSNGFASFTQREALDAIMDKFLGISDDSIIENGWLNFDDIYRKEGWKVARVEIANELTFEFKVASAKYA